MPVHSPKDIQKKLPPFAIQTECQIDTFFGRPCVLNVMFACLSTILSALLKHPPDMEFVTNART